MNLRAGRKTRTYIWTVDDGQVKRRRDDLTTEEPLEIRLVTAEGRQPVAVMRTPANDFELAAGYLLTEGIITQREQIQRMSFCVDATVDAAQQYNIVNVELLPGVQPNVEVVARRFTAVSACGLCGQASLDALRQRPCLAIPPGPVVAWSTLLALPEKLRACQHLFQATGGVHAAALFDLDGELIVLREDIGRHNAVDKLIGWALMQGQLPLHRCILMLSGRASFEIAQKCLVAGIPIVCSVSAPSSLAVSLAREFNMTLIGFLRGRRGNVYAGIERIHLPSISSLLRRNADEDR